MAINYEITARELVKELGGDENIINVTHCATRLRFILKDESGIDSAKVARIPGVITTVQAGGQYQVVIGNHVSDAYAQVMKLITVDETAAVGEKKKTGIKYLCTVFVYTGSLRYLTGYPWNFCGSKSDRHNRWNLSDLKLYFMDSIYVFTGTDRSHRVEEI